MVTEHLARSLEISCLTGFELDEVTISKSPEFEEMYPGRTLPGFRWLRVTAVQPADADFRLTSDLRLEVSDAALALLRKAQIVHAEAQRA